MAKDEIQMAFSCSSVNRPRGGAEQVTLTAMPEVAENQRFFGTAYPNASISISITHPDGKGVFDPELDYDVIIRPRAPAGKK